LATTPNRKGKIKTNLGELLHHTLVAGHGELGNAAVLAVVLVKSGEHLQKETHQTISEISPQRSNSNYKYSNTNIHK